MMKKKVCKSEKGITLTALVVMIVMMMILAGTSIHFVKNGEETLNDSKEAATMYKDTTTKSSDELSTMAGYSDNKSVQSVQSGANSSDVTAFIGDSKVITVNGNYVSVSKKGSKMEATIDTTKDPSEYDENTKNTLSEIYGTKITYKSDSADNEAINNRTWRIFFIDFAGKYGDGNGAVYLKADWYANDCNLDEKIKDYSTNNTDILKNMNPKWWKNRGSASKLNPNEIETEYLCDTNVWKNYTSSVTKYAIGSPSIEMFCDSYNSVNHEKIGNYKLTAEYSPTNAPGYILKVTNSDDTTSTGVATADDSIDYKNYNSMYCGVNKEKGESGTTNSIYWWFSSPSSNGEVMHMNSANAAINKEIIPATSTESTTTITPITLGTYGDCPVVSIKIGTMMETDDD